MYQDPNQQYPQYGQAGEQGNYQQGYQGGRTPSGQQPDSGYQAPYGQPSDTEYQQQRYGRSGYQQSYNAGNPLGTSSMSIQPNIAAALSYVGWWITGLFFFLGERRNRFVRFHAMQSILVFIVVTVIWAILKIIFSLPIIGLVGYCLGPIAGFATFLLWAGLIIMAFLGKQVKIPVLGDYAERFAGQDGLR